MHARTSTHRVKQTHIHTTSNTYSFHHKMAASEKEWGSEAPHAASQWWFCILMVPLLSSLYPSFLSIGNSGESQAGSKQPATSPQEDRATQFQDSISRKWIWNLNVTATDKVREGSRERWVFGLCVFSHCRGSAWCPRGQPLHTQYMNL